LVLLVEVAVTRGVTCTSRASNGTQAPLKSSWKTPAMKFGLAGRSNHWIACGSLNAVCGLAPVRSPATTTPPLR